MKKSLYGIGFFVLTFLLVHVILSLYIKDTIPDEHLAFIEENGWHIDSFFPEKNTIEVPQYPEALETFRIAKVHFNESSLKPITEYRYRLKETCHNDYLEAVILSSAGKRFGSYLDVSDSIPGITEMLEMERYMDEFCLY